MSGGKGADNGERGLGGLGDQWSFKGVEDRSCGLQIQGV